MDNYIIQQINIASKLGVTVMFLAERLFNKLQASIKDVLFKRNGYLPVIFSPFYSKEKFNRHGIENIIIRASNGKTITICNL